MVLQGEVTISVPSCSLQAGHHNRHIHCGLQTWGIEETFSVVLRAQLCVVDWCLSQRWFCNWPHGSLTTGIVYDLVSPLQGQVLIRLIASQHQFCNCNSRTSSELSAPAVKYGLCRVAGCCPSTLPLALKLRLDNINRTPRPCSSRAGCLPRA